MQHFCPCHFTALCPCPGAAACCALGCGSRSVCGDLPEQAPGLAETHVPVQLPGRCTRAHGERRRKGRHAATVDYPCYGYMSIVGHPPFSLGERSVYFEKFNMIFSGPDYFKNSMLTMLDGQVLKYITEALFRIYEPQSLVLGRRGRGDRGSGNRTVSSVNCTNTSGAPQTSKAIDYLLGTGFLHVFIAMHTFTSTALICSPKLEADRQENVLCHPGTAGHTRFTEPPTFFLQRGTGLAVTGTFPNPP